MTDGGYTKAEKENCEKADIHSKSTPCMKALPARTRNKVEYLSASRTVGQKWQSTVAPHLCDAENQQPQADKSKAFDVAVQSRRRARSVNLSYRKRTEDNAAARKPESRVSSDSPLPFKRREPVDSSSRDTALLENHAASGRLSRPEYPETAERTSTSEAGTELLARKRLSHPEYPETAERMPSDDAPIRESSTRSADTSLEKAIISPEERKPVNILLVTNNFKAGGAETHILSLAKGLTDKGYNIVIASSGGSMQHAVKELGVPHIYAPLSSRAPHNIIGSALILKKAVKKYHIDMIHSHSRLSSLAVKIALFFTFSKKARFVTTAHLDFKVNFITRAFSCWGERTLAVSEDIRGYLIKNYRLSYDRIDVTVNGIDCEHFVTSERNVDPDGIIEILHISRLDRDRAYTAFLLCDAIVKLRERRRNIRLTIAGGGELEDELRLKAQRINKLFSSDSPAIRIMGEVHDVRPLLQAGDIFIGVSRAALEAMACGLPTILSGNTGYLGIFDRSVVKEAARTNFCCRTSEPPTVSALVGDIEKLLSSDLSEIKKYSKDVILHFYSLDRMIDDHVAFYGKVLMENQKAAREAVILGYHGFGNSGDDAVLDIIVSIFKKMGICSGFTVLSGRQKGRFAFAPGIKRASRYSPLKILRVLCRADMLIVGGGTLLQADTSRRSFLYYSLVIKMAKMLKRPVIFYSNGMSSYTDRDARMLSKLFSRGRVLAVLRDNQSADMIRSIAPEAGKLYVCADCGLLTEGCCSERYEEILSDLSLTGKYAVIAPRPSDRKTSRQITRAIAGIAKLSLELGVTPILVVMQENKDMKAAKAIARMYKRLCSSTVKIFCGSYRETASLIFGSEFTITQRMHAAVFAASAFVPSFIISDDPKCRIFAEEYLECFCCADPKKDEEGIKRAFSEFYRIKDDIHRKLKENIPGEKLNIEQTAASVKEDILQMLAVDKKKRHKQSEARQKRAKRKQKKLEKALSSQSSV